MSALRWRSDRHGWSGNSPRSSQCCQWCAVQTSLSYASSYVRGAACSLHDERAERRLALLEHVPRGRARALDAEVQVRRHAQLDVDARRLDDGLVVVVAGVLPAAAHAPVVEHRLADQRELHLAVDAAHGAQQDVVGVVVGRRAAVGVRAVVLVVPRADQQRVADDDPAAARAPAGLQHHRAGQVAARGRHLHAGGAEPEDARVAVQQRAEDARRVHPRQAHPLHVAARRDERGRLAVRQEAVVGDRGERTACEAPPSERVDHGSGSQRGESNEGYGLAVGLGWTVRLGVAEHVLGLARAPPRRARSRAGRT